MSCQLFSRMGRGEEEGGGGDRRKTKKMYYSQNFKLKNIYLSCCVLSLICSTFPFLKRGEIVWNLTK